MEVILKNQPIENPTFGDVETNQQFINGGGRLCVKLMNDTYVSLCNGDGEPDVYVQQGIESSDRINLILPEIERYVLPEA